MRIAIFNVKYSPNLGDGVLAHCLEMAIASALPAGDVVTFDLAGRTGFDQLANPRRLNALQALEKMPAPLRRSAVRLALTRKVDELRRRWSAELKSFDAVVIGGGNLLQDDDLNFPLKIAALLDAIDERGLPIAIAGAGVTSNWSNAARRIYARLREKRLVHVWLRDEKSGENWRRQIGTSARIQPDPAVSTSSAFTYRASPDGPIGVCVTHPAVLRRHSGADATAPASVDVYAALCLAIDRTTSLPIRLFTNGATEDDVFASSVLHSAALRDLKQQGRITLVPRPHTPAALVADIGAMSAIVGHRLHASIVAFSLGVPHVGLPWDPKVKSFFQAIGRSAFLAEGVGDPDSIAQQVATALAAGVDIEDRLRLRQRFANAVADLLSALSSAIPERGAA